MQNIMNIIFHKWYIKTLLDYWSSLLRSQTKFSRKVSMDVSYYQEFTKTYIWGLSSVAFYIETSHLVWCTSQMTGF